MTCEEIRELISCMLDNELNAEDSAIVTEHLASCPECMCVFEAFHAVSVSLEELEDLPDDFTETVMQRIRATASPKRRRRGLIWLAGMAACLAVILLAGTSFSSTHQYVDGSNREIAQYVNIITPPKRLPVVVQPAETAAPDVDKTSDEADIHTGDEHSGDPTVTPAVVDATPAPTQVLPTAEPTPTPTPKPVVIPIWPMTTLSDLLLVVDYADYNLHTGTPDAELDVVDRNGNTVKVSVWMELEHNRLYCKSKATQTAWYTIGTPKQLLRLMRSPKPTPTLTPAPATPTPDVVTPTPEEVTPTPDVVTPTPEEVTPTPVVVTPIPEEVAPTPVVVTPIPSITPDEEVSNDGQLTLPDGEHDAADITPVSESA